MAAGECLHAVFEHADFADASSWPAAVDAALRAHPLDLDAAGLERARKALHRMLHDVLNTPLRPGFRMAEVTRERRRAEMEFHLPAAGLGASDLAVFMREHGYPTPGWSFTTLQGYLHGFIDLVFEHDGRYYIVDWKGNHLGSTAVAYAASPVARAMAQHGYHLQYLLYAVAVHRLLQQRLPDYDYERHFGGVMYLFVRGVRPGWTGAGVHEDRPPRETIERLSALLDCARKEAA
jgi:exodeoxyribonuclease V beta subunit